MRLGNRLKVGLASATAATVLAISATCNPTPPAPISTPQAQPTATATATSARPGETPEATATAPAEETPEATATAPAEETPEATETPAYNATPQSTAAPQQEPTPRATPTKTAPEETPTVPSPSPTPEQELPDLEVYMLPQLQWEQPITVGSEMLITGQETGYDKPYVGVGIRNAGAVTGAFSLKLYIDGVEAHSWNFSEAPARKATAVSAKLEDIVRSVWEEQGVFITGGNHAFRAVVDADGRVEEADEGNNSYEAQLEFRIARETTPRKENPTETEKKIYEAYDNFTWYSKGNMSELAGIADEWLRQDGLNIDWTKLSVKGYTFEEHGTIRDDLPEFSPIRAFGFAQGSVNEQTAYVREGLMTQITPTLLREVGGAHYLLTNLTGYRNLLKLDDPHYHEIFQAPIEAYGKAKLREMGIANLSYLEDENWADRYLNDTIGPTGKEMRWLWAALIDKGIEPGNASSDDLMELYKELTSMEDPRPYVLRIAEIAENGLDREAIAAAITNREFTDKAPVLLPQELQSKLDPERKYSNELTLDRVMILQNEFAMP